MRFFSSSQLAERFWSPLSLPSNGYPGGFAQGLSDSGVRLSTQLHTEPRLGMVEIYLHSLKCLMLWYFTNKT
jgi:hypothetical protein